MVLYAFVVFLMLWCLSKSVYCMVMYAFVTVLCDGASAMVDLRTLVVLF